MLSYFGCDQSQVQRYLTARSESTRRRSSLLMSAYWKIPLQVLVLMIGVLVFVFYLFVQPPMLFNPVHDGAGASRARAPAEYAELEQRVHGGVRRRGATPPERSRPATTGDGARRGRRRRSSRADAAVKAVRKRRAPTLVQDVTGDSDLRRRELRLPDVRHRRTCRSASSASCIAAIIAAAMSSIAAELNSLATATVIDFYRRLVPAGGARRALPDGVASSPPAFWGLFACVVALFATSLGSLIEVVNRFGSFFYGSILGVFMLAIGHPARHGHGRVRRPHRRHAARGRRSPSSVPTSRSSGTTSSARSGWSSSACW